MQKLVVHLSIFPFNRLSYYLHVAAIHLNACSMSEPKTLPESSVTHLEKEGVEKGSAWMKTGVAYQAIHATRSSTIDLVLSTNSVALLAWFVHSLKPLCPSKANVRATVYQGSGKST